MAIVMKLVNMIQQLGDNVTWRLWMNEYLKIDVNLNKKGFMYRLI